MPESNNQLTEPNQLIEPKQQRQKKKTFFRPKDDPTLSSKRPNCLNINRESSSTNALNNEVFSFPTTSSLPEVLVVMTYNRIERLRLVLTSISDIMKGSPYHKPFHLIVTQSVDTTVLNFAEPVIKLLERMRNDHKHAYKMIEHVQVPIEKNDKSFTNNLKLFGNKKNSMNNLIGGLKRAKYILENNDSSNVIIMEDDVVLSCDILEYFSFASKLMDMKGNDGTLKVASTELLFRPSFFVGNHDTSYFLTNKKDPSSTIIMKANSRSIVKTYSWMLSSSYVNEYLFSLINVVESNDGLDDDNYSGTLHGCYYCQPYCYDHVAEWTLAKSKSRIIYPSIPRVTQTEGSGMTYSSNPLTLIYQSYIKNEDFNSNGISDIGNNIIFTFDLPGTSCWTNHGPTIGYYVFLSILVLFVIIGCLAKQKISRIRNKNGRMKRR
jgi:hypothetical protein